MNDDIFKIKPSKSAEIEDDSKYIINAHNEIMQKLRMLQKSKCLVTAYFDDDKQSMLTAIIDILPAKNLLLLDYGPDEAENKLLMSGARVTLKSQLAGVTAQFSVINVKKARYQGQTVFACKVPDSLLWVQRRDTYRIKLPMGLHAFCLIHDDHKARRFEVHDISVGGMAFDDPDMDQMFALGSVFEKCEITLPEFGTGTVALEVRNHLPIVPGNDAKGRRIGCVFVDLRSDVDAMIQRFIHSIETQHKKLEH